MTTLKTPPFKAVLRQFKSNVKRQVGGDFLELKIAQGFCKGRADLIGPNEYFEIHDAVGNKEKFPLVNPVADLYGLSGII